MGVGGRWLMPLGEASASGVPVNVADPGLLFFPPNYRASKAPRELVARTRRSGGVRVKRTRQRGGPRSSPPVRPPPAAERGLGWGDSQPLPNGRGSGRRKPSVAEPRT